MSVDTPDGWCASIVRNRVVWINVGSWTCNLTSLSFCYTDSQQSSHLHHQQQEQQQHYHHQLQHHHQHHQQQQQQWRSGIRVLSNSPSNSAFHVDALPAQFGGDGGQRCVHSHYPEDYCQDPGRDGDIHDFSGHQSRGYY